MEILDVADRQKCYEDCQRIFQRIELGLRAASIMYDEFSSDKASKENIFRLKENIDYRLSSASQLFRMLLEEHFRAEQFLSDQKDNPFNINGVLFGNPFFPMLEKQIATLFDSIVFNIVSAFDYLSHIVCYICQTNKQQTFYWTRLAKAARGQGNDIARSLVRSQIDSVDRRFVTGLYDYRSRLIHDKRDLHQFTDQHSPIANTHFVQVFISDTAGSFFKRIYDGKPTDSKATLLYLASWLIGQTSENFELILDGLIDEIRTKSNYFHNLRGFKGPNTMHMLYVDPATNTGKPVSEMFWNQFKTGQL